MDIQAILLAAGIPTAVTGMLVWLLQRHITNQEEKRKAAFEAQQAREEKSMKRQEQYNLLILDSLQAVEGLTVATAKAVQRIPDAHCNGDMHEALEYSNKVAQGRQKFIREQAIDKIYD